MPPHSSHLLQPLDVGCFAPLKKSYGKQVEENNHMDKQEFLASYKIARTEALNINNIRQGFTATGLVPYDPNQVLSRFNIEIRTPSLFPSFEEDIRPWLPETPHNIVELSH